MEIEFSGKIIFWRGPAPWFFVTVPAKHSRTIKAISSLVTYGWEVIPVHVRIGKTEYTTSLFPKDGRYLVPIKASVRKAEDIEKGDKVACVRLAADRHFVHAQPDDEHHPVKAQTGLVGQLTQRTVFQ